MDDNSYAVIKYEWFQDKELNYSMIIILGLLNSLCRKNTYCWATNKYIGEVVNLNDANTSKYINKLKELGYDKGLNEITNKLPENKEICKDILKMLQLHDYENHL